MSSPPIDKERSIKKQKVASNNNNAAEATTSSPLIAPKKRKRHQVEATETAAAAADDAPADDAENNEEPVPGISTTEDGQDQLSKADKAKAKKRRKEQQRALDNPPSFAFDTRGFKGGRMVQIKDVRDFVLHLLSDEKAQQWLYVANKRNIQRVVTLMIPGITAPTLGIPQPSYSANLPFALTPPSEPSQLPIFQSLFSHACPTKAPGDKHKLHSCYQHFINCPLTGGEKERREKARKEQAQLKKTSDPTVYLMTKEQMAEQAYPVPARAASDPPSSGTFEEWLRGDAWVEAPYEAPEVAATIPKSRKVLGIDCEMCLTEDGSELTRVSVVDLDGKNIYDSLVKPDKPILDYLTRYSGLTEEKLSNVTKRLIDVQRDLSSLISYNTILNGHSLECDLRVLKLVHPFIIDTSVIYQHPRGPPFKASLKWLAQKWLKREIQSNTNLTTSVPTPPTTTTAGSAVLASSGPNPSVGGHDSEEDARTCIDLLKLKMEKGPGFGEFQTDQETIFERLGRGTDKKRCAVVDHGTPGQWHGAKANASIACTTDEEVVQGVIESLEGNKLVIGRFMELSHALGWSQPSNAALGKTSTTLPGIHVAPTPSSTTPSPSDTSLTEIHARLNGQLAKLHASLPPLTALIIFTGHNSPLEMTRLTTKKNKFDRLWKTVKQSEIADEDRWMEADERKLVDEVEKCRVGLGFYCVK